MVLLLGVVIGSSFTTLSSTQEKELIIGNWHYEDEVYNKWVFTNDKCFWKYNGDITDTFNYQITEAAADNGIDFSCLKLVDISNNDVYEYEINALTEDHLTLDYLGDMSVKLMMFEK